MRSSLSREHVERVLRLNSSACVCVTFADPFRTGHCPFASSSSFDSRAMSFEDEPPHKRHRHEPEPAASNAAATAAASAASAPSSSSDDAAASTASLRHMLDADHSSRVTMHFPAATAASSSSLHSDCGAASGSGSCIIDSEMAAVAPLPADYLTPFPASDDWSYFGAKILAPMVRICTLPMRQLALRYGASMVYSEELVAKKLRNCLRSERNHNGRTFVEFTPGPAPAAAAQPVAPVEPNSEFVQSSSAGADGIAAAATSASSSASAHIPTAAAASKPKKVPHNQNLRQPPTLITVGGERLVVQIGAATANDALAAAQVVARDCRAIDVNMGCPKHFSLQGGMGAALLSKPETVADILGTLRRNLNLPITCKIRLLHSETQMVELVRRIESMGVSALALHARHIEDRPRHRALPEKVRLVASTLKSIPLIYNGDACFTRGADEELEHIRATTGAASIMCARGAMWNASIFRPAGILPLATVVRDYMSVASDVSHPFSNTKYCVMEMLKGQVGSAQLFRDVTRTKTHEELLTVINKPDTGMDSYPALAGKYSVPIVLEERAAPRNPTLDGEAAAARAVELVLAPSPSAAAASSSPVSSVSVVSDADAPVASASDAYGIANKKMSFTERKYFAKQNRKNREGRKKEQEEKAQASAAATAANNTEAPAAASSPSPVAPQQSAPSSLESAAASAPPPAH